MIFSYSDSLSCFSAKPHPQRESAENSLCCYLSPSHLFLQYSLCSLLKPIKGLTHNDLISFYIRLMVQPKAFVFATEIFSPPIISSRAFERSATSTLLSSRESSILPW